MQLDKQTIVEISNMVAETVVKALAGKSASFTPNNTGKSANKKTAFQKTEQLLHNYNGFKKIIADRELEIEELRKYGVPQKSGSIVGYSVHSGSVQGTVLPEDAVESAVCRIHCATQDTVRIVTLIEKCMKALENDPYYRILEMRYFEGKTLEEIAFEFSCDHSTISRNKNRLVKELSIQIFPDDVVNEIMNN